MKPEDRREAVRMGMQLRRFRLRMGWSQRELADRIDISHQMIQKYEAGTARLPSPRLKKIVDVLGTTHAEFLDDAPTFVAGEAMRGGRILTKEEERLLTAFHRLTDNGQRRVVVDLVENMAYRPDRSLLPS